MLLEVQSDEAVVSKIKSIAASVNYAAKRDDLLMDGLKLEGDSFEFEILDADEASKFDAILHNAASGLDIQKSGEKYRVTLTPEEIEATKNTQSNRPLRLSETAWINSDLRSQR